ncbi:MAG: MBOAT family protein, partial [Leptonema sp. (in: Bacteria)]|nr:MBOAT family protein [Leptonema sp. (in: bacteria)]
LTFLVWGALHGFYLVVERSLKLYPKPNERLVVKMIRAVIVFHLVLLAWSFFRADSISAAFQMMQAIATSAATQNIKFAMKVEWLLAIVIAMHIYEYRPRWFVKVWQWRTFVLPAATVVIGFAILSFATASVPFIYFQF